MVGRERVKKRRRFIRETADNVVVVDDADNVDDVCLNDVFVPIFCKSELATFMKHPFVEKPFSYHSNNCHR